MSENGNRRNCDFSIYDTMSTEELEEILRLDAEAPEGEESDTELLLYVMEVLAKRRKSKASEKTALEAYESFKQHYLPKDEKKTVQPARWLRSLTAAAAVLAVIFCGTITAKAFGLDLWKVVAVWAQETFHLSIDGQGETDTPNPNSDLHYSSLQEALVATNRDPSIVPTWIPDGYELSQIDIWENPMQKVYYAIYENEDTSIKVCVQSYINSAPEQIEQSEGYINTYSSAGVDYYFFEDKDNLQVAWIVGTYECYVSGKLTIDELEKMIDSIQEGKCHE